MCSEKYWYLHDVSSFLLTKFSSSPQNWSLSKVKESLFLPENCSFLLLTSPQNWFFLLLKKVSFSPPNWLFLLLKKFSFSPQNWLFLLLKKFSFSPPQNWIFSTGTRKLFDTSWWQETPDVAQTADTWPLQTKSKINWMFFFFLLINEKNCRHKSIN